VYFFLKHPPHGAMDPNVMEFLRYVLSREGQAAVAKRGAYLPLTAEAARQQMAKLASPDRASAK